MALAPFGLLACGEADTVSDEPGAEAPVEAPVAAVAAEWSYAGSTGPAEWATLSDEYAVCEAGSEQSPIALSSETARAADLPPLTFGYAATSVRVEDSAHGLLVTPETSPELTIGEDRYTLLQFHAHDPSEHTLDGRSYPLEIHFVHRNAAGELAVVGLMVEEGAPHPAFGPLVEGMRAGGSVATVALAELLPDELDYFTYDGSLTTPPCSEGVRWIVLEESIEIGPDQMEALTAGHGATNRPVQPLEERVVRTSS